MIWLSRAWGYYANISGSGKMLEAVQADSPSHYQNLIDYLAPETNSNSAASGHSKLEIKNGAVATPLWQSANGEELLRGLADWLFDACDSKLPEELCAVSDRWQPHRQDRWFDVGAFRSAKHL